MWTARHTIIKRIVFDSFQFGLLRLRQYIFHGLAMLFHKRLHLLVLQFHKPI